MTVVLAIVQTDSADFARAAVFAIAVVVATWTGQSQAAAAAAVAVAECFPESLVSAAYSAEGWKRFRLIVVETAVASSVPAHQRGLQTAVVVVASNYQIVHLSAVAVVAAYSAQGYQRDHRSVAEVVGLRFVLVL